MNFLSLFAGIGGIDLGLERAGMRCVGQVEIDPFARAVLARHWPDVPRFEDVRTFGRENLSGSVELICGGFPCQDISVAGKGRELEGERSGLWWEYHRIITEFRPAWVVAENVPALRSRGADDVLSSLEAIGYAAWPVVVGAEHVGAPHRRHRVWIVGHACGAGAGAVAGADCGPRRQAAGAPEPATLRPAYGAGGAGRADTAGADGADAGRQQGDDQLAGAGHHGDVADTGRAGLEGRRPLSGGAGAQLTMPAGGGGHCWPARPGEQQHGWEAPRLAQFPVGGAVDGVPVRLVRAANRHALKALGNSVVPQIPELIGRWIIEQEAA